MVTLSAAAAPVAGIVGVMAVNAVSKVAGDHATWYVLTGTYNATVDTCTAIGGSIIGKGIGKLIAPSMALSSQTVQTANALGGCVTSGVSMTGMAVLGYYTGTESALSCGSKIALGVGGTALAAFSVANAPAVATVLTVISAAQTIYSLWPSAAAVKTEEPAQGSSQAVVTAQKTSEVVSNIDLKVVEEKTQEILEVPVAA